MSKTTALHVHHPFWYISFIVLLTTPAGRETLQSPFTEVANTHQRIFLSLFLTWIPENFPTFEKLIGRG